MFTPTASILNEFRAAASGMRDELSEMATARLALARLELADSQQRVARLTRVLIACATCVAVATSALVAVAVVRWHRQIGDGRLCVGAGLVIVAAVLCGFVAYRRFRRDFTCFNESLAELREDAVQLSEWIGTGRRP